MATGFLALLDDIVTILDDVAVLTKIATKKTSGVIGDDLALNAQQMGGISPEKELPIIYAVAKGALINKAILVPLAIIISYFTPSIIPIMLMFGGAYLCFEGVEKVLEKLFHFNHDKGEEKVLTEADKIKGAIRTDFILSAEIIVISLASISHGNLLSRIIALSVISVIMTIGVYGLVALIVKLDDMGLHFIKSSNVAVRKMGTVLLHSAPILMKILAVVGTIAMFLVGGGIIAHGIPVISHSLDGVTFSQPWMGTLASITLEGTVGILAGLLVLGGVTVYHKAKKQVVKPS